MPIRKDVEITIKGKDKLTPATKSASRGLNDLAKSATALGTVALVALAAKAIQAGAGLVKLGAQSLTTKDRLIAFAGGVAEANGVLEALIKSSDGTINRMTATAMASRLLEQGLIGTTAEAGIAGAMIGKLGVQTWSTDRRMQSLTMLLANQSTRRLDDFGLSVTAVTAKQKKFEEQGYSTEQAFTMAVFAEAEVKLGILGDTSGQLTVQLGQQEAAWADLRFAVAEQIALMAQMADVIPTTTRWTKELTTTVTHLGTMTRAQIAAWKVYYLETGTAAEVQEAYNAVVLEGVAALDEETAALKRTAQESAESAKAQVADRRAIYAQIQDLIQRHHEYLQDVAYRAAQKASQTYIAELRKAQQAALAILASEISARNWQLSLEGMYQQHLDRLASIRDSYRESEQQKENERGQAIVARLNEEYQARKKALDKQHRALLDSIDREHQAKLDALNREYGKAVSGEDRREQLEEEHRRRLMGIYTESARKQEKKRYAAALKELEYEEKKAAIEEEYQEQKRKAAEDYEAAQAALEKEFQSRKEAAVAKHEANLKQIAERAMAAELAREQQRYRAEVQAAQRRRALQQRDEARRLAIIQQYEAQRQAERAIMQAREIAHQATLEARREAAYRRQLDELVKALSKLTPIRVQAEREVEEAARRAKDRAQEAKNAWSGWGPMAPGEVPGRGYQHGGITSGGTVLVGEAGPELLNLPGGTRITPLTGGGLAPIVIHNHFGASSVRSERDIRRIAELQERTLRLRGQGVVS